MSKVASRQVNAAYEMGRVEARVSINDGTLKARDLTQYLKNAEIAQMMADTKVLEYIEANNYLNNTPLKNRCSRYRAKYWKSNFKITKE